MSPSNGQIQRDVTERPSRPAGNVMRSATGRAAGFLGCWLILTGGNPADLPAGVVAVAAATWTSLHLMPPGAGHLHPLLLAGFVSRFLCQAVIAGFDVAWRALHPRLPLQPGFVAYQPLFPPGTRRNAFCAVTSLLPGTLPSGPAAEGGLLIHCLDQTQPVADQLAVEEALFARMCGGTR
jgi:multicomponent Na+:H+ antiporter subunit E